MQTSGFRRRLWTSPAVCRTMAASVGRPPLPLPPTTTTATPAPHLTDTACRAGSGVIVAATAAAAPGGSSAAASPATVTATAAAFPAPPSLDFLSLRGVLFDVDGTLVESDPLHFRAFREILSEVGFNGGRPIDEAFFRTHISGRHNPEIAADLFPAWDEHRRTAFYMDKEERYRRLAAQGLEPLKGLREFLAWVRQHGLRTAAVTNAPRANAEMMLEALGLDTFFEHLVLGEECTRAKPHPDPYLTALELLGLSSAEAVVFEDSPSGVLAGVAAGCPVVALTTGQDPDVLSRAGAVWIVRDFRDVMAAVRVAEAAAAAHGSGGGQSGGVVPPPQRGSA